MTKEAWDKLKRICQKQYEDKIELPSSTEYANGVKFAIDQMKRIEDEIFPEIIGILFENFDHEAKFREQKDWSSGEFNDMIARAYKTGDTSDLEKWQKKEH